MAYSVKYLFKFESAAGTTREIRVLKDGYSGDVIQRPLGRAPMLKKQQNGPVHGTSLEFYAECNVDREFIEFYTSNPKDYRVDLYAGSTLLWQGYITPELYSEPDIAPPYDVQVVATDGVGELKLYDYAVQGTVTLRNLLAGLLTRTGLGTDIYLISSLKPGSAGAGSLLEKSINLDYMAGKTCYDVLTYILDTLHATITWWKGAWILTRETNVTFTNGKVRYFNTAGNSALLNDSVQVLGVMRTNPAWPVGQLSTVIDPAKNKVAVQAPWHPVTCLQNADMASDTAWAKYNSAAYNTGAGGYYFPYPLSGIPQLRQQVSMAGIRVPLTLSVRATAATAAAGQGAPTQIGAALIYTVGGISYHLRKGTDGGLVWEVGPDVPSAAIPPRGAPVDFSQALAMWDAGRIEAEELKIENIPAFMQNGTFPAGTLTVYILGYCATVYGVYLDVVLPKGYQDILCLDNGARGEGSTVEIAIGRETTDNAYYAAFLQGLLLDSGSLITSFSDANFTTGMDYLAFIARDYALSVALPRAKVTGTVFLESSVQFPPLVFSKGVLNYWVETWGWNLYEDELEIEARTLPSASLSIQSETILESDGSTVSSSSGSGGGSSSSMGGGGGANYFEINEDLQTLIQPKNAYDYLSARDGLFFTGGDTSTPTPDLYVDTVNNQRVLRSPLPLITGGDQIVLVGTPGGGGGGGGATTLAGLDDTNITNPTETQVLQYLGGKWKNVPSSAVGVTTPATSSANGLMSAEDYNKLAGIAAGATAVTESTVAGWGFTKNTGTVTSVKVGNTSYNPTSGVVSLPAYPTTLPASDVYAWAKASTKPSYAFSELTSHPTTLSGYGITDAKFGTAGTDNVPITLGSATKNVLTAHQTVTLASGTNNGTLKLTTAAGTVDNIAVKGLGSMAYETASNYQPKDADLTAIAALTGSGILHRNTNNTWELGDYVPVKGVSTVEKLVTGGLRVYQGPGTTSWDGPSTMNYAGILSIGEPIRGWQMWARRGDFGLYWRNGIDAGTDWANERLIYDSLTLTKSVLTNLLESSSGYYVKKSGDTMTGALTVEGSVSIGTANSAVLTLNRTSANYIKAPASGYFLFVPNGAANSAANAPLAISAAAVYAGKADTDLGTPNAYWRYGHIKRVYLSADAYIEYNSNGYIYLSKPLVTAGDQIVISGTPGGGGSGGATTLKGLDDTTIPDNFTTVGPVLYYNGSKWVPSTVSSLSANDVLQWNGAKWVNTPASSIGRIYSPGTGIDISGNTISLASTYVDALYGVYDRNITQTGGSENAWTALGYADSHRLKYDFKVVRFSSSVGAAFGAYAYGSALFFGGSDTRAYISIPYQSTNAGFVVGGGVIAENGASSAPNWYFKISGANGVNYNLANFLTGNQTITLSGDVSGSGTTSINVSIGSGKVTNAMLAGSIANGKLANSSITINGSSTSLGGSFNTASITAGTAGQSTASSGLSLSIPYVTLNAYGIATAYGTHTHTISAANITTAIGDTTYAPYNADGYLPLSGGTLSGSLTVNATTRSQDLNLAKDGGAQLAISSIAAVNAGAEVGSILFRHRYGFDRNGIKIAGVYPATSSAHLLDLVFYSSNNGTSPYAPDWKETMRITSGGNVTLSGLLLLNYANARIVFQDGNATTLGAVGVRSSGTLEFYDTSAWRTVWHANNSNLSTVNWTTKMLNVNGRLYMKGGNSIEFDNASGTARGLLGANDSKELLWHDGSWRTVYHSNNANKSDVAWACSALTASGGITGWSGVFSNTDNCTYLAHSGANSGGLYIGSKANTSSGKLIRVYYGQTTLSSGGTCALLVRADGCIGVGTDSPSQKLDVNGNIHLSGFIRLEPGQNVNVLYSGYAYRLAEMDANGVNHLCYGGTGGVRETRLYGNGIIFYNNSRNQVASLNTSGTFTTTGDQVVSSDLTKKTNLIPIDLKVEQIAAAPAVTFDWKTGGHSFGSIAQYWKDVLGEAVLGTEGNYALAYGQLALVNTIIEAREIDKLKARVAELEAEVKRLTAN